MSEISVGAPISPPCRHCGSTAITYIQTDVHCWSCGRSKNGQLSWVDAVIDKAVDAQREELALLRAVAEAAREWAQRHEREWADIRSRYPGQFAHEPACVVKCRDALAALDAHTEKQP